ncbi:conserved hypothetical protein [Coccidioides posadasii str. Silveira]|uniref:Uncharacterized protein n=1 Tax=Coccidioides posadasii (strain RMSCC 757 / Silveira) TaxID=443226 RepID=E9D667_COCPS|nr:conserved hypothetical protein [Coccidioides posadasii str. Silveira]
MSSTLFCAAVMESNDEISYRLLVAGLDSPIEAFGISEGVDSEVVKPAGDGFGGGKMAAAWRHALEMRLALPSVGKKFAALKLFLDVCVGFKAVHWKFILGDTLEEYTECPEGRTMETHPIHLAVPKGNLLDRSSRWPSTFSYAAGQRIPLFDFIADRDRQNLNLAIANHGRGLVTFSRTRQIQRADCRRTRLEREPTLAGLRVRLRRRQRPLH